MSKKVYIITVIISIVFIALYFFLDNRVFTILSSIGCSGLAAALMAFFLESALLKKEAERIDRAKYMLFRGLIDELRMILERVLWFDARMDDMCFEWNRALNEYSSLRYMVSANKNYPEEVVTFEEAEQRLTALCEKYSLNQLSQMTSEQLFRTQKMFQIVAASSSYLVLEANTLRDNKLELDSERYISLEETKKVLLDISLGISLMNSPSKNYSAAISSLLAAYKMIQAIGKYTDDFRIGLHGSIDSSEL